jgi:hypothetical protein
MTASRQFSWELRAAYPPPPGIKWRYARCKGKIVQYTRDQAAGCLPNGSRVVKCATEPCDTHSFGSTAVVIGSVVRNGFTVYFVEWDDEPGVPYLISDWKITLSPKRN